MTPHTPAPVRTLVPITTLAGPRPRLSPSPTKLAAISTNETRVRFLPTALRLRQPPLNLVARHSVLRFERPRHQPANPVIDGAALGAQCDLGDQPHRAAPVTILARAIQQLLHRLAPLPVRDTISTPSSSAPSISRRHNVATGIPAFFASTTNCVKLLGRTRTMMLFVSRSRSSSTFMLCRLLAALRSSKRLLHR